MTDQNPPSQNPPSQNPSAQNPSGQNGGNLNTGQQNPVQQVPDELTASEAELTPTTPGGVTTAQTQVLGIRTGMWGSKGGSGDTSGYGGISRTKQMPGLTDRPYGGWFDEVADRIEELVPGFGTGRVYVHRDEITFFVRPDRFVEVLKVLRDDAQLRFEVCVSVSGVHYPGSVGEELHVVYEFLSITHNRRIRIELTCTDENPHLPSAVAVYPHTDWHERETWDMFGVIFDGHPALTRILMPDDWQGHPQRKDYPLGGVPVEYKGAVVPPPDDRRSY